MSHYTPDVDIIVPFYKCSLESVNRFISAINAQEYQKNKLHLILVDNNERPGRFKISIADMDVTILECSEVGSYAARNYAVHNSNHDILVFSDIDCQPQPTWISELINAVLMSADSNTIAAGAIKITSENERFSLFEDFDRRTHLRQEKYVMDGYAATANLAVQRAFFNMVGEFDSNLLSGGDEDWCRNAINNHEGELIYVDSAVVTHPARRSFASIIKKNRRGCGGIFRRLQRKRSWTSGRGIIHEFHVIRERWDRLWEKHIETSRERKLQLTAVFFTVEIIRILEFIRLGLGFDPERQ